MFYSAFEHELNVFRLYISVSLSFLLLTSDWCRIKFVECCGSFSHDTGILYPGIPFKDKVTNEKSREETALPKLEDIIRCRRLRWLAHLSRMDHHRLPRKALTQEPEGFRRPGWPRQNWKDIVKKDLRKMGISWDEVEKAAEDRSWRNCVAQWVFDAGLTRNQDWDIVAFN